MNNILTEAIGEDGLNFRDIYNNLMESTNNFTEESGDFKFDSSFEASLAENILKDKYSEVEIKPLDMDDENELFYTVLYKDPIIKEDYKDLDFQDNKNPEGTPLGSFGESLLSEGQEPAHWAIIKSSGGRGKNGWITNISVEAIPNEIKDIDNLKGFSTWGPNNAMVANRYKDDSLGIFSTKKEALEKVKELLRKEPNYRAFGTNAEEVELLEKIIKFGSKWQVQSEKGKNMGTYNTKKEAEDRLKQVEYFKHINEGIFGNIGKTAKITMLAKWISNHTDKAEKCTNEERARISELLSDIKKYYNSINSFKNTSLEYDAFEDILDKIEEDYEEIRDIIKNSQIHESFDSDTIEISSKIKNINNKIISLLNGSELINEDRKSDIESTLLDGEPTFAEYMEDNYGIDIYDDEIAENPDVEDHYLNEYESYLDHLYDLDDENNYDAAHAAEWMERYPHGYYNNENDYGVDDEDVDLDFEEDEVNPDDFLQAYELTRDMDEDEAWESISQRFDNEKDLGFWGPDEAERGKHEVFDYWKEISLKEDFDPEDLVIECPQCLNDLTFVGYQGDLIEFKCDNCENYFYMDPDTKEILLPDELDKRYLTESTKDFYYFKITGPVRKQRGWSADDEPTIFVTGYSDELKGSRGFRDGKHEFTESELEHVGAKIGDTIACRVDWETDYDGHLELEVDVVKKVNESLKEAAPRKNFKVELYYYDNQNPGDTVYFPSLKDAYKFCAKETEDDDITGITGIIIYNNSTDKKINAWQNGSRGWEKKVNESLNEESISGEKYNTAYKYKTRYITEYPDGIKPRFYGNETYYYAVLPPLYKDGPTKYFKTKEEAHTYIDSLNESLAEAKFSSENSNDDIRLVKASYDHFMNDLGEIPSPDDILYDILDNYNQDIFQEGGPMIEGKEIESIKYILRSQGLEYRGDFDESLNEDNNTKKFEIKKELIDNILQDNGNAPIDVIFKPDYYYVNIIDAGDTYILEGDETNIYNMLVPFDLQWRIYPIYESLTESIKPLTNYSSYKLAKLLTDKYYDLTMGKKDKQPFNDWFNKTFGAENRKEAANIISNFTIDNEKRVNKDDLFYVHKYVDRVASLLTESLTEDSHETLNKDIWDENNELRPEVREKLNLIVEKFKDNLSEDGVDLDISDIIIVGSNANYNYTDKSDIDLHIIANLDIYRDKEDLAKIVYNAYRRLFNDKFDPTIRGHEVEIYVEPNEDDNDNNIPDEVENNEE